jgi:hypothetical protein
MALVLISALIVLEGSGLLQFTPKPRFRAAG